MQNLLPPTVSLLKGSHEALRDAWLQSRQYPLPDLRIRQWVGG